ncbi:MAG: hypothetical protein GY913_30095 [Proteobacteria bacterium]|nr:hypothetical protein [Pseudomonadota bacterium]MCP4921169.1 hypothetical protein [Pseudomonadota bacterium]
MLDELTAPVNSPWVARLWWPVYARHHMLQGDTLDLLVKNGLLMSTGPWKVTAWEKDDPDPRLWGGFAQDVIELLELNEELSSGERASWPD